MFDKSLTPFYTRSVDLDNEIQQEVMPTMEGDLNMGRQKVHVTLPSGELVWITGSTFNDLIQNALLKYGTPASSFSSSETFKEYTTRIFDVFLKPRWKDSTANTNLFLLDKHITPYFGTMQLSAIDTASIQRFFQTKQHLSKSYAKQMLIILHEIFENAVEDKILKNDPTQSKRITLPQKVTKREALEPEHFKNIVENLSNLNEEDARFMAFLCFTGMRRGEILGLKWENVTKNKILVRSEVIFQCNTPIYHEYAKSKSGIRDIPIAAELDPYLLQKGEGFVFGGSSPYTQSKFDRMWQRIGKKINLYGSTPHVFRHTYLTILAASNVDPKTIQSLAGHADFSFTFNKYIDKNKSNIENASTQFSKHLQELTQKLTPKTSSNEDKSTVPQNII